MMWDNVYSKNQFEGEVAMIYDINKVPTNYLINPEGKIIAVDLRGDKLDQKLEELFADKNQT